MNKEVFIDTNILVYLVDHADPRHKKAQEVFKNVFDQKLIGVVSPQIFLEFAAIASDGRRIPQPLSASAISETIVTFKQIFKMIIPTETALSYWEKLIKQHGVNRQKVFDVFLVATVYEYNIPIIYTENTTDFQIYSDIEIVNPLVE